MKKGEMLNAALKLAVKAHDGQYDRSGTPYIMHPLKVLFYTKSDDEEIQCIAILHDTVEDSDTTWYDLEEAGMTPRIVAAVKALTKVKGQGYDEYRDAVFANKDAMLVKLADLRHNTDIRRMKGVTEKDRARMARYHAFAFDIQQKL